MLKITVRMSTLYDLCCRRTPLIVKSFVVNGGLNVHDDYVLTELIYALNNSKRKDKVCENYRNATWRIAFSVE